MLSGSVAQWVKHLLNEMEDLSLDPRTRVKSQYRSSRL